jgi:hypothetical protein
MRIWNSFIQFAAPAMCLGTIVSGVIGCSVYQSDLSVGSGSSADAGKNKNTKKSQESVSTAGKGGMSNTTSNENNGGNGGTSGDRAGSESAGSANDGGAGKAPTYVPGCGDGRVSESEKCDIFIEKEFAGYCPLSQSDCPVATACSYWQLAGEGCQAYCQELVPRCSGGDGCCPPNCTQSNDSDCSDKCGDGIVEVELGETCEKTRPQDAGGSLAECPTKCEDDTDPCTVIQAIGSVQNCNFACIKTTVTDPKNNDGCCPAGANANTDNDCTPTCGNGIPEGKEICDGTPGCNADCSIELTAKQLACVNDYPSSGRDCDICMCVNCYDETVKCYDSGDKNLSAGCQKVIDCGYKSDCLGSACYCGGATGAMIGFCVVPELADGPCKSVIEQVAGTNDLATIVSYQSDPTTALGLAQLVSTCYYNNCLTKCKNSR